MGGFFAPKILAPREWPWGIGEEFGPKGCKVVRNGVKW